MPSGGSILNRYRVKYYSELVRKYAKNPRALFKIINRMLHRNEATPLPPHSSDYDLANEFSNFFKEKIQCIQDFLDNSHSGGTNSKWQDQPKYTTKLTEFKPRYRTNQ